MAARYGLHILSHSFAVETTDDSFSEAHIIPVSPKIAGRVIAVHVNENQEVKQGDVLVELDPTDLQLRRESQSDGLSLAKATNETALKGIDVVKARLDSALAQHAKAVADETAAKSAAGRAATEFARIQKLSSSNAVSVQDVDASRDVSLEAAQRLKGAEQGVISAQAGIVEGEALVEVTKLFITGYVSKVHQAEVALKQSEQDLTYTKILAPEDGRVTRKGVEPGAYVQTGQNLMALVPHETWVIANYKETQLRAMHAGQSAEIKFDAYPSKTYRGHVDSIQSGSGARFSLFPPENASGNFVKVVQRVPVKIIFDEPLDATIVAGPGLSVEPEVLTGGELLNASTQNLASLGAGFLVFVLVIRRRKNNTAS